MSEAGLIPKSRLVARRRRRLVQRWALGLAAVAGLLVLLHVALALAPTVRSDREPQLAELRQQAQGLQQRLRLLDDEILQAQVRLAANRAVSEHPDWSVLLAVLSQQLQDQVVLRQVELIAPERSPQGIFVLHVQGHAESQAAVSQFVLRLEGLGLFETVKLVESRRAPILNQAATGFRLECPLMAPKEPAT